MGAVMVLTICSLQHQPICGHRGFSASVHPRDQGLKTRIIKFVRPPNIGSLESVKEASVLGSFTQEVSWIQVHGLEKGRKEWRLQTGQKQTRFPMETRTVSPHGVVSSSTVQMFISFVSSQLLTIPRKPTLPPQQKLPQNVSNWYVTQYVNVSLLPVSFKVNQISASTQTNPAYCEIFFCLRSSVHWTRTSIFGQSGVLRPMYKFCKHFMVTILFLSRAVLNTCTSQGVWIWFLLLGPKMIAFWFQALDNKKSLSFRLLSCFVRHKDLLFATPTGSIKWFFNFQWVGMREAQISAFISTAKQSLWRRCQNLVRSLLFGFSMICNRNVHFCQTLPLQISERW